jgi:hypothetical protein
VADASPVALSGRQKRALTAQLRDAIFRLFTAAGMVVGLFWAMNQPAQEPPASCSTNGKRDALADCVGDSLVASLMPYILAMGAGDRAGAVLGVLVAQLMPRDRRRRRHQPTGPARWITARYAGRCVRCSGSIAPGDRISTRPVGHCAPGARIPEANQRG